MRVDTGKLAGAAHRINYARSKDCNRFGLDQFFYSGKNKELVATDGHRLAKTPVDLGIKDFSIPFGTVDEKDINQEPHFPDYEKALPRGNIVTGAFFQRKDLVKVVQKLKKLTHTRNRGVYLTFHEKTLYISAHNPDNGTVTNSITTSGYDRPTLTVCVNVQYLLDEMKATKAKEVHLMIFQDGEDRPVIAFAYLDDSTQSLLMPMIPTDEVVNQREAEALGIIPQQMSDQCLDTLEKLDNGISLDVLLTWNKHDRPGLWSAVYRLEQTGHVRLGTKNSVEVLCSEVPEVKAA